MFDAAWAIGCKRLIDQRSVNGGRANKRAQPQNPRGAAHFAIFQLTIIAALVAVCMLGTGA